MKHSLSILALIVCLSSVATGTSLCNDRTSTLNYLAAEYGEQLIEAKKIEGYGLLEILKSPTKGTWTLLVTDPNGNSCILATGKGLSVNKKTLQL